MPMWSLKTPIIPQAPSFSKGEALISHFKTPNKAFYKVIGWI